MWLFEVAVELWSETEQPVSCGFFQLIRYFNNEKVFLRSGFLFLFSLLNCTGEQLPSSGRSQLEATLVVFALLGHLVQEQPCRDICPCYCQLCLPDVFLNGPKDFPNITSLILIEWTASAKLAVKCTHHFSEQVPYAERQRVNLM